MIQKRSKQNKIHLFLKLRSIKHLQIHNVMLIDMEMRVFLQFSNINKKLYFPGNISEIALVLEIK